MDDSGTPPMRPSPPHNGSGGPQEVRSSISVFGCRARIETDLPVMPNPVARLGGRRDRELQQRIPGPVSRQTMDLEADTVGRLVPGRGIHHRRDVETGSRARGNTCKTNTPTARTESTPGARRSRWRNAAHSTTVGFPGRGKCGVEVLDQLIFGLVGGRTPLLDTRREPIDKRAAGAGIAHSSARLFLVDRREATPGSTEVFIEKNYDRSPHIYQRRH